MKQKLEVNLTIPIPDDSVLIKKSGLRKIARRGIKWRVVVNEGFRKENQPKTIMDKRKHPVPSKFRKILDIENGGFVFFILEHKVKHGLFKLIKWLNS